MKKIYFLFIMLFFINACSTEEPEGNPSPPNPTFVDPFDSTIYPSTLNFTKPSLYIKDYYIKGYLPYPILNGNLENDLQEEFVFFHIENEKLNLLVKKTLFKLYASDINGVEYKVNLFDGSEANINHERLSKANNTNNDLYMEYIVMSVAKKRKIKIYYKQTGTASWAYEGYINDDNWEPSE